MDAELSPGKNMEVRLFNTLQEAQARIASLEARLSAAVKALAPFAEPDNWRHNYDGAGVIFVGPCDPEAWTTPRKALATASGEGEAGERRELLCERCGREHPVWFAPNELWNKVIRAHGGDGYGEKPNRDSFLCPLCFVLLAEERGVHPTAWVVSEEVLPAEPPGVVLSAVIGEILDAGAVGYSGGDPVIRRDLIEKLRTAYTGLSSPNAPTEAGEASLRVLLDAIERGRALLPNGSLLLEAKNTIGDCELWHSDASMLLDEDDLAALRALLDRKGVR